MTDVPPPPRLSRPQLVVQAICLVAMLWLYGGDLVDALRLPGAELAAFVSPPTAGFAGLAVALTLAATGAAAFGHLRRLGKGWKGHRLLPIVTVVVLFADLLVVSSTRVPVSASDLAAISVHDLARRASELATTESVPTRLEDLTPLLKELGEPPYLVRGARVPVWGLEVRGECERPAADVRAAPAATFLYCVSPDKKTAWVTLVGLPWGQRFGERTLFVRGRAAVVGEVNARTPPDEDEQAAPGGAPPPAWGDQLPDAGD